jgi:hypothetical protein
MTAPMTVPHEDSFIQQEWLRLATGTAHQPGYGPAMIADLPEPARPWLTHAITPGTPLWPGPDRFHIRQGAVSGLTGIVLALISGTSEGGSAR